jgi:protein-disulfide isomerase
MSKSKTQMRPRPRRASATKSTRGKPATHGLNRAARRRGQTQPWWQRPQAIVAVIALFVVAGIVFQALRSSSRGGGPVVRPPGVAADGGVTQGPASATVAVTEYGDFQCPNCARLQQSVGPTIDKLVADGRIRFTYVPMAFLGPESDLASNAAYCAGDRGKFWEYHGYLFAHQAAENSGSLTATSLTSYGNAAGVTGDQFATCVKEGTYLPFVRHVTDLASQRGVNGTPTLYINGSRAPSIAYTPGGFAAAVKAAAAA